MFACVCARVGVCMCVCVGVCVCVGMYGCVCAPLSPLEEVGGDEALGLVAHGVAVELALGLGGDGRAVRQGEAVQRRLGVALQEGWGRSGSSS